MNTKCNQCIEVASRKSAKHSVRRKQSSVVAGLRFLVCVSTFAWLATPGYAVPSRVLNGHIPAAVAHLAPIKPLAGTNRLHLVLGLPLRNAAGLTNLLQQLYDPASPNYHRFLTPAQFTERFGPSKQAYQSVLAFARSKGFTVTGTHRNRLLVDVEAPVTNIEATFGVNLRVYPHPHQARTFYAPDQAPTINAGVPILDVSGLNDYSLPQPANLTRTGSGTNGSFIARDLRAAYVPGVALDGYGQSVGIVAFDGFYTNDIAQYESLAGLPNVPLTVVPIDGGVGSPGSGNLEVALDIEMAIAMAPGLSHVIVYEAPNGSGKWVDVLSRMANDDLAKQLSSSWAGGDPSLSVEQIFLQMAAQGQTFVQASGDSNAYGGQIPFPSDDPNVTVVGGTSLTTSGPGGAWTSEIVWNEGTLFEQGHYWGSGGGYSTTYWMPWWQQSTSMANNGGSTTHRDIPDVAMAAHNILTVANNGQLDDHTAGTSAAAPLWAGFVALVNQQATTNGKPPVGFLNPALYAIGNGTNYLDCFHDITVGSNYNYSPYSPANFIATTGYDLCTGWGSPIGTNLINALVGTGSPIATNAPSTVVTDSSLTNLYTALLAGGRITFDPSITYDFHFDAPIPIVRDTTIDAAATGASVVFEGANGTNGTNATRLFTVCSNVTFQVIDVTLRNGQSPNGGAILNQGGTLIAKDCMFTGNKSIQGGAILNEAGVLIATNCDFEGNLAVGPAGLNGAAGADDPFVGGNGAPGTSGTSAAGGAVYNLDQAQLYRCRFETNSATGGNGGQGGMGGQGGSLGGQGGNGAAAGTAFGGAIYSTNLLVLGDCTFEANTTIGGNGGQGGLPGTTSNTNSTSLSASGLSHAGAAAYGGAIYSEGQLQVSGCTFATNSVVGGVGAASFADATGSGLPGLSGGSSLGGAIYTTGTNSFVNCTFSANGSQGGGGGNGGDGTVYFGGKGGSGGSALGGTLEVAGGQTGATNCTFANSWVVGGVGGMGGTASTNGIANSDGLPGSNGGAAGGILAIETTGTMTVLNCIVADSTNSDNCFGVLVDAGHNLSSDATCRFSAPGSMNDTNPLLGPLGDYGGPTQTMPPLVVTDAQGCQGCNGLLVRSPAIDAGAVINGGANSELATDQRGVPRPQGNAPDIGAFECVAVVGQVRGFDGSPLPNVTITLLSVFSPPLTTVSDAQGHYEIVAPPDMELNRGVYRLSASYGTIQFSPAYDDVELPMPTSAITEFDFTEPLAIGQVRRSDGSPFTNIAVSLTSSVAPTLRAVTDESGNYQFVVPPGTIVPPGAYQVTPQAADAVFSPASRSLTLGASGTRTGIDFTQCAAVGQVRQYDGTPFSNVVISLLPKFSPFTARLITATDTQGRFQIVVTNGMTLTPGTYQVVPQAGDAIFTPAMADVDIGPATATDTNLDFAEPVAMGLVRQADGSPFTNITVTLTSTVSSPVTALTDAQGRYVLVAPPGTLLNPGQYRATTAAPGAVFSPAWIMLQLGMPRTSLGLDFTECAAVGQVWQCDGASPFTNVTISVVSTSAPPAVVTTSVTDSRGQFQLAVLPGATLPPGGYRVVPQAGPAVFAPAFLDVPVGPATATRTNLDFREAVAVGQVWQSDGQPFTNVTLWLESKSAVPLTTQTDGQGQYEVVVTPGMTLNAGRYSVVPAAGGALFSPAYAILQIPSPAATRVHLDFVSPLIVERTTRGGLRLSGAGAPGQSVRIEASPVLPTSFWQPLGTLTNGIDSRFEFTDPNAQYFTDRFYRVVPAGQ